MTTQDRVDELRYECKQAQMRAKATLRRALKAEQERDDAYAIIRKAQRILLETYTEEDATPLHEQLLSLLAAR